MGKIIDGSSKAVEIKNALREDINQLKKMGIEPGLATILIGTDPASIVYIKMKQKTCNELGIHSEKITFSEDVNPETVQEKIRELNASSTTHGILVQLPIPPDFQHLLQEVDPQKDVDGFHSQNMGRLAAGDEDHAFIPCTPLGILTLLEDITSLNAKDVTIVNHSPVIGRPLSMLLLNRQATVTICHVHTKNLKKFTKNADILITATGVPHLIKAEMVKPEAIVIDAGFARVDGKIVGDVDFDTVKEKASHITPPTGGVGPMTIAMLLQNTVKAAKLILPE